MSTPTEGNREQADRPDNVAADEDLVRRTLDGDLAGFDELVRRYQRKAVSVSYRLVGNVNDAMEICQDAFLRGFRSLKTLKEPARFGPWLMRIVSNLSLNFRRSRRSAGHLIALPADDALDEGEAGTCGPAEVPAGGQWSIEEIGSSEAADEIQKAIAALPEKQRLALTLFAIEGWSQRDVAEIMGCSLEAVKWNVFAARKALKEKLAEYL